ncbi:DUF1549 domain-containing protein [Membranihabitans maritimus]|uniref:DUF1549 domain-containing protein n=1 Tax=Membranihabitans maritimus TaxID=2904244 RepID=UPI001F3205F2|nr:DUF1549 domain-containing protein [Membranihabitans maritimus]
MSRGKKSFVVILVVFIFLINLLPELVFGQELGEKDNVGFWFFHMLGRFHPMVVHFPISFILLAAVLELYSLKNYESKYRTAINTMLYAGVGFSIVSIVFGLLLKSYDEISGSLLNLHQWLGIATGVLSVATLWTVWQIKEQNRNLVLLYRSLLFGTAIGVTLAGHFGASVTHGSDYLRSVTPWANEEVLAMDENLNLSEFQGEGEVSMESKLKLLNNVRAVFAHKCYKCHSSDKMEGELRLDEKEFVFKGGENGEILIPGDPENSDIVRRINLPEGHDDVMPSKGKLLSEEEKSLIALWIQNGAIWPEGAEGQGIFRVADLAPREPNVPVDSRNFENKVDVWVDAYFREHGIEWRDVVDDKTYLKRIYLDIVGLLPEPEEIESFARDDDPEKRKKKVLELLSRDADYTLHWLSFWNDILRNDYTGTGYITKGRFSITEWLYRALEENKSYDAMVKELLSPSEESRGFIAGIQWRGTVNASQRTEMQAAQNVAQVMLGLNLKCASCHDSFISDWKLEDAYAFANIFADSTLEINRCDKPIGKYAGTRIMWEELGAIDSTATRKKKMEQLSERLVQPENGRLYRTIVNRYWAQLMGRGIIEPVDEMDNLPWSQDLLDWLAVDFEEKGSDLKDLIFQIVTSRIYQMPTVEIADPADLKAEDFVFKGMVRRRVTAEQFSDAVSQVFYPVYDYNEIKYNPYGENKTDTLPPFYTRASLVANNSFLTALGRPNREVVATDRTSEASLLEALELTNGERLNMRLKEGAEKWVSNHSSSEKIVAATYAKALGRKPNAEELKIAVEALGTNPDTGKVQDFFWAMVLHPEFQLIY